MIPRGSLEKNPKAGPKYDSESSILKEADKEEMD